jgi:hypothetical protein
MKNKKPRSELDPSSYMRARPSWRLGNVRMKPPFGWSEISRRDMQGVLSHLASLETMTWNEILVVGNKHNHFVAVSGLSKQARENLDQDWQGAERIVSLRLSNLKRIWGVIEQGIFHLLWWDPDHMVYPSTYKDRLS